LKKAQAAIEFLTTYGWVILVVLISLLALAYFGVFDAADAIPEQCFISPALSCFEFEVSKSEVMFGVLNNLGGDVDITAVQLSSSTGQQCVVSGFPVTVKNGGKALFNGTGCISGSRFKGNILIGYRLIYESVNHTVTGSISGRAN